VRDIGSDVASGAIARALITLGQVMGLSVIAEGIETEEQREFLTRLGCHTFQGFLFSHPVPAEEFETFRMGRADQRVRSSSKANSFEGVVRN
jgi:EAL domain-containing protein (putative c-di-GMP-specific phosphodiesterase class I)